MNRIQPKVGDEIKIKYGKHEVVTKLIAIDNLTLILEYKKNIIPIIWNAEINNWTFENGDKIDKITILKNEKEVPHTGAFILPIDFNNEYVVLGRETKGDDFGTFDSFGGRTDPSDENNPLWTASREFAEEGFTNFIFGINEHEMRDYIKNNMNFTVVNKKRGTKNVIYIARFHPDFIDQLVNLYGDAYRAEGIREGYHEKDEMTKIKFKELLQTIRDTPNDDNNVYMPALVTSLDGTVTRKIIHIRPVLVSLLRGYAENAMYTIENGSRFYSS